MMGAYVSIGGAIVTIVLNILWIPVMGYMGSAWATLICYGLMALVSYILGQKYYPVPYESLKVCLYISLVVIVYLIFSYATEGMTHTVKYISATVFMLLFTAFVYLVDGKNLSKMIRG
jgi:peptidoglycan biosynthesis protein MviN/MurJ (putative lipid II flippase)